MKKVCVLNFGEYLFRNLVPIYNNLNLAIFNFRLLHCYNMSNPFGKYYTIIPMSYSENMPESKFS